ncbi:MAG: hypothetical protein H6739_41720 [Alphaproteobacteria bacterium]|nr:hypothetical protein [Alphaproteobacteria bacterium]
MAPTLECLLVPALAALRGEAPAPHPVVLQAPANLDGVGRPGPPDVKGVYGGRLDNHVDSVNFTVAWENGEGDRAAAELASAALEDAWNALIVDQGWTPPVSSDDYWLWVILDPSLNGTGLTVPYTSTDYPQGYPVIFLNPDYASYTDFFRSLAAHEFMHAIQFATRDYYQGDEETWYWEASAEWGAELALPSVDAYGAQSGYYSSQPELRYSSTVNFHQYGMFVLNAWIDEHSGTTMQDVWTEAEGRDGEDWDVILADATGQGVDDIWGGFTQAMATGDLREFRLYDSPNRIGGLTDGASGSLAYLATDYYLVNDDTGVRVSGDAVLASRGGVGEAVNVYAGQTLAVTGLDPSSPASYTLTFEDFVADPDDTGLTDDTGGGTGPFKDVGGTLCGVSPGSGGAAWLALLGLLGLRRRRVTGTRSRPRPRPATRGS